MFSPFVFYSTFSLTFILPHRLHLPLVFASSLILSHLKHCPHPCSLTLTVSHSRPPWQLHFISPFYFQVASGSDPYHGRELYHSISPVGSFYRPHPPPHASTPVGDFRFTLLQLDDSPPSPGPWSRYIFSLHILLSLLTHFLSLSHPPPCP